MFPSPRLIWPPPEPSMLYNAEVSSQIGANGVAHQKINKHGNSESYTGPMLSTNNKKFRSSQMVGILTTKTTVQPKQG